MKTLLQIKSSIFSDGGQSSRLAERFVAAFVYAEGLAINDGEQDCRALPGADEIRRLVSPELAAA